jgi:hypothetical protein
MAEIQLSRQTGSRNLTGPKTLPTIWHTYMKLVTKYQIPVVNSCWEKCDEKQLLMAEIWYLVTSFIIGIPYRGKRFWTHQIPTSCLPTLLIFIHIEYTFCICTFLVAFFSATIDVLIIDLQQYLWHTCCISSNKMNCELMLTYDTPVLRQTGSRNLTGQKTLPTIWGTYMKLVTKYLHIGMPYCGKCFWTHQIPTSCLPTLLIFIHIEYTFCICTFLVAFFSATMGLLKPNKK